MGKALKIRWLAEPDKRDYPEAESYLNLIYDRRTVAKLGSRKVATCQVPVIFAPDSVFSRFFMSCAWFGVSPLASFFSGSFFSPSSA